jgi:site-specific DNA-methyltransferase (adenine-specific)
MEGKMGGSYEFRQDGSLDGKVPVNKNHHPTVKPIKLMRWLCRLVTPPGGTVIDPFMGSGTTGIACKVEKLKFIGIEREKEYFEIAQARLKVNKNKSN